ncbi:hypothetical protein DOTSEDRAFT_42984 [Lecanosticta acicola]|uniref:SP-RING-type domain-containing protein n=1 Tax=Lecanosticta acicola TaxID=111012 RepID=A0AAI8YW96_9PEZI|nr:hypothetical protein DOTSEDRAFT_42984 [Lecanosticta acicola]
MVEVVTIDSDSPPPPKRRRTAVEDADTVHAPPSAIAQTNSTLQHMLGGRHNRWMHGFAPGTAHTAHTADIADTAHTADLNAQNANDSHEYTSTTNAVSNAASNAVPNAASHRPHAPSSSIATEANSRAAGANLTTVHRGNSPQEQEQPRSAGQQIPTSRAPAGAPSTGLVQYETPVVEDKMLSHPTTHPAIANGSAFAASNKSRKAVDAARPGLQPGLPSPAPSDENTNSPTFAVNHLQLQHARSRPSLHQLRIPTEAGAATPSARPMATGTSPGLTGPQHGVQTPLPQQHTRRVGNVTQTQQAHVQVNGHAPGHPAFSPTAFSLPAFPNGQHRRPPSTIGQRPQGAPPIAPSNGQALNSPTPPVPSNIFQPTSPPPSRVPSNVLMQRLASKETELAASIVLSPTDNGRIYLLREAIQKGDYFYQMVSQLFCLSHTNPTLLPRSMRNLDPRCYAFLSILLCENARVSPALVQFCAEFPEPVMDIYSDQDGFREVYEMRVAGVKEFLNRLPRNWDGLIKRCKESLSAPPVVQDIVEALNIRGTVLQTVVFRAIARMVYGNDPIHTKAITALEQVHRLDQDAYYVHGLHRHPQWRMGAYLALRQVYEQWQIFLQRHQEHRNPSIEFVLPQQVMDHFRSPHPNAARSQQPQVPQQRRPGHPQSVASPDQNVLQQRLLQAHLQNGRGSPGSIQQLQQPHQALMPPQNAFSEQSQTPQARPRRLFPAQNDAAPPQPTHPDFHRAALHQALLRSPIMKPAADDASRLYRHVIGFGLPPTTLKKDIPAQKLSFSIPAQAMQSVAKNLPATVAGEPERRDIKEASLMYRLRCSVVPPKGFVSESDWVTAENYWPEEMRFMFNDTVLDVRRKLQHGRYVPIDLTALVREGTNNLEVFNKCRNKKQTHAVAIEVVGVIRQDSIEAKALRIAADQSLDSIKRSLSGDDAGDDDLAVTSSALTIKLFDPYSGCRIFDTPVRGSACLHKDCFDLQVFLECCKRKGPGWPTIIDCWRCPICRGDVRPQTLVLDEFLVSVREELARRGQLDTRAIIVQADGTWKVKGEDRDGVRSPSLEREEQRRTASATAPQPNRVAEIIELD